MATLQHFAALLERPVDLFRDPAAKGEQKAQFRTLAGLLKGEAVTIAVQDGRLWVNSAVVDGATLLQRLEFHSVKEIAISADPPLSEVFELLRVLAEQPGEEDIASRLRAGGATRISVRMQTFVFGTPIAPVSAPPPPRVPPPAPPSSPKKEAPREEAATASAIAYIPEIARESTPQSTGFSPAAAATR